MQVITTIASLLRALSRSTQPLALLACGAWLVACSSDGADPADTGEGTSLSSLPPGVCVTALDDGHFVGAVSVNPCEEPHAMEVLGSTTLDDGAYPGTRALMIAAYRVCVPVFMQHVGEPVWDSRYDIRPLTPSPSSWAQGDRAVVCLGVASDGSLLSEPLRPPPTFP